MEYTYEELGGLPSDITIEAFKGTSFDFPAGSQVVTPLGAGVVTDSSDHIQMARVKLDLGETRWFTIKELDKP